MSVRQVYYSPLPRSQIPTRFSRTVAHGMEDDGTIIIQIHSTRDIGDYDTDHIFSRNEAGEVEEAVGHEMG